MAQKHSRPTEQGIFIWYSERLWQLADTLPSQLIPIKQVKEFEQNCWFSEDNPPTCKAVADHARRINEADLSYPIILSAAGHLMDGGHRLAKAWLLGQELIRAVQFPVDPEPDIILPPGLSYTEWKRSRNQ
jgi:hypothetical protein